MDLTTKYLGFELPHPLMPGASPLVDDLDTVRRLEDAGAAAIVMHSLFEEQIVSEQMATHQAIDGTSNAWAEAMSYFPEQDDYRLGPEEYLEQLRKIKEIVSVPVIASLNGTTLGGWLDYAKQMEQAGADALELNVYSLATDPAVTGPQIEQNTLEMVRAVKKGVEVPVAVKLSPFYSSLSHFAQQLDEAGVDGIVLFNRFYQPDIDIEELEVERTLQLSTSSELLLRLRWLAILSGNVKASLALTGGVHTEVDAIKAVMTGAHAVQVVSTLLQNGPERLQIMREAMAAWLEEHEYQSLQQMQGSMNLSRSPDPKAFERANYMHILASWNR
ncbi:MAG: dihydroorotate dehydrogenase-like protein [Candidatus Eisenbacteria bacterium]|nr:dihydroorotate dehydrogenase-like protein [Candidatus Latescibacterota bacterium]MBD3302262.1 dihydroorotate dehydrogenase-like protein [Candidatus Eisenbacteria bacterium]